MSDIETAPTGGTVAPAQNSAPVETTQVQGSESTNEQQESQQQEQPRDESGKFIPRERFNEVYAKGKQAERHARELEQRLAEIQSQLQRQTPQQPQMGHDIPDPSEFGYDMKQWGDAVRESAARAAVEEATRQLTQSQQNAYRQQIFSAFDAREQAFAAENPAYFDRVATLQQAVELPDEIIEAFAISDYGPQVIDYLAQHLDEADKLSRLPPHLAAMQLGRIEARVSAPKTKPVSAAPQPPPALKGGTAPGKSIESMTTAERIEFWNSQGSRR